LGIFSEKIPEILKIFSIEKVLAAFVSTGVQVYIPIEEIMSIKTPITVIILSFLFINFPQMSVDIFQLF
jgi:hypothetical protein